MKILSPPVFYAMCTTEQLLQFTEYLQKMGNEDVLPALQNIKGVPGYVQDYSHYVKINKAEGKGFEYLAVDVDYFWKGDNLCSRVTNVTLFDDADELELERYKDQVVQTDFNPILN